MKRIAVFTATRAEYGLLRPVVQELHVQGACPLLVVSGSHLDAKQGKTITEIEADNIAIDCIIPVDLSNDSPVGICGVMAETVGKMASYLAMSKPDALVLLGDRYETLAAATAAYTMGIPIAHLHGGELTFGAMDEGFRHAITKFSYLHFTSTEEYRRRVIQLGEAPDRVFHVGALGVEIALQTPTVSEEEVRKLLNIQTPTPYLLATYHPVTRSENSMQSLLEQFCAPLDSLEMPIVFTGANADQEGQRVNAYLQKKAKQAPNKYRFFHSLGIKYYHAAVRYSSGVIGNSSSGILEVPSLGVPTLNIGDRQKGRTIAPSVICCTASSEDIGQGLEKLFSPVVQEIAKHKMNPYHKERTAQSIARQLVSQSMPKHTQKAFYDI